MPGLSSIARGIGNLAGLVDWAVIAAQHLPWSRQRHRVVLNFPDEALIVDVDGSSLAVPLPPFVDCRVEQLFEVLDRLPDHFGLLVDRQAARFHVFELSDGGLPQLSDDFIGQRARGDQGGGELDEALLHAQELQQAHFVIAKPFRHSGSPVSMEAA